MFASIEIQRPERLDVVALPRGRAGLGLPPGARGTVVEELDDTASLVEFANESGEGQAIVACAHRCLRVIARA